MSNMRIDLLVVPDCPNEAPARALLSAILAEHGVSAVVATTVVSTADDAQARGFTGSPTFLIDGVDPFAQDGARVGLACRVYRTARGVAGLPDREALTSALTGSRAAGE
jgi:hypothetical protein